MTTRTEINAVVHKEMADALERIYVVLPQAEASLTIVSAMAFWADLFARHFGVDAVVEVIDAMAELGHDAKQKLAETTKH